jgi:hypothetical protein
VSFVLSEDDMPMFLSSSRGVFRRRWLIPVASVPLAVPLVCWWFTEPLVVRSSERRPAEAVITPTRPSAAVEAAAEPARVTWPSVRLEGEPAKKLLLVALLRAQDRLSRIGSYTATFQKQERIRGKLGPRQTLAMKVRQEPFSIYLKFLKPKAGKEVVFCEGNHDNHVIAHNGDWTRRLIPRLKVAPTDPLALADSRHPVTDAGLHNLTDKLVAFRRLDLEDPDASTMLDWQTDDDGRTWPRSVHTHPHRRPERPFAHVEVLYDPDTLIPRKITSYDWPEPGDVGELKLAESYGYDDLDLEAALSDHDFDPANPEYAFTRF